LESLVNCLTCNTKRFGRLANRRCFYKLANCIVAYGRKASHPLAMFLHQPIERPYSVERVKIEKPRPSTFDNSKVGTFIGIRGSRQILRMLTH
jgi:hypothetical protein